MRPTLGHITHKHKHWTVLCKSVYNLRLSNVNEFLGKFYKILRVTLDEEGTSLRIVNEETESIAWKDERPG